MKKSEAEYFKDLLRVRLKALETAAGEGSRAIFLVEDKLLDRLDQATDEQDKQLKHRMRTRATKLTDKINLALQKIDEGTFGICERCGGRISKRRLKARPVTKKLTSKRTDFQYMAANASRPINSSPRSFPGAFGNIVIGEFLKGSATRVTDSHHPNS